ncbi:hypothetical protein GCM10011534_21930 [Pseudooceanicola nanhaiensis]|uniref:Uncharacterized protein n=1 Tax=Pseudooceanicola nanhaiensis TaxID=375761 RepID=A0A917WEF0_9RHOB|nr:hypothetical protein GCM10011534_21930 [Pseudooceanicola nanhaiensis]
MMCVPAPETQGRGAGLADSVVSADGSSRPEPPGRTRSIPSAAETEASPHGVDMSANIRPDPAPDRDLPLAEMRLTLII